MRGDTHALGRLVASALEQEDRHTPLPLGSGRSAEVGLQVRECKSGTSAALNYGGGPR